MANPTDYYPARYSANYRRHKNDACCANESRGGDEIAPLRMEHASAAKF
jgi:hypothetical protein